MQTYAQESTTASEFTSVSAESVRDESSRGESLQRKASLANNAMQRVPASPRPNNTGLPDNLKSGVESLSGYSLDNVRVHYNSSKPPAVQAYAYTQGTDIHIAPGQEKRLPHEAWHVTQQMSGRVAPTTNVGGMPINDDSVLEREADSMGSKAVEYKSTEDVGLPNLLPSKTVAPVRNVSQRKLIESESKAFEYGSSYSSRFDSSVPVGTKMVAELTKGEEVFNNGEPSSKNTDQEAMMADYRFRTQLKGNQLVKGHLLNEHLGGRADNKNLFPITDGANSNHLYFVENNVKELVLRGRRVRYSVNAAPCDGMWNTECRKAKFECHYETFDHKPKQEKKVTIYSIIDNPTKKERGKATDENDNELDKSERNTRNGLNNELRKSSNKYNMCNVDEVKAFFDYIDECIADTVEILAYFLDVEDVQKVLEDITSKLDDLEKIEFEILEWAFKHMGYSDYFAFLRKVKPNPKIDDIIDPSIFIQFTIFFILNPLIQHLPEGQEKNDYISKLNVEDYIGDILSAINLNGMTKIVQDKLSTAKEILDKISIVTDNIECILGDSSFEELMSEMDSSKKGRDAYKKLGKKITKEVIKKIIKVADIVIKMVLFSKSVADLIADPEERELLFENVINVHFAPKVHAKKRHSVRNTANLKDANTLYSKRHSYPYTTNRVQNSSINSSYNVAYISHNAAYSNYLNQEKVSSGSEY